MTRRHIVFLTGAGVSAESGLCTFRGKDGLWTNEEWVRLASTEALYENTQKCLDFYNWRRKHLAEVEPNEVHRLIAVEDVDARSIALARLFAVHAVDVFQITLDALLEENEATALVGLHPGIPSSHELLGNNIDDFRCTAEFV